MRRLICAFVVRIGHKQVFSWRGWSVFLFLFSGLYFSVCPTGPLTVVENGFDGPFKMDPGTLLSLEYASGRKRRITEGEGSDEDEAGPTFAPPIHDIYRSRQQKRAKWWDTSGWQDSVIKFTSPSIRVGWLSVERNGCPYGNYSLDGLVGFYSEWE